MYEVDGTGGASAAVLSTGFRKLCGADPYAAMANAFAKPVPPAAERRELLAEHREGRCGSKEGNGNPTKERGSQIYITVTDAGTTRKSAVSQTPKMVLAASAQFNRSYTIFIRMGFNVNRPDPVCAPTAITACRFGSRFFVRRQADRQAARLYRPRQWSARMRFHRRMPGLTGICTEAQLG